MSSISLLAIVGSTASGKSGLAMELSRHIDIEIIAADSLTVYKGLDIGTAKPSQEDQRLVPHHLLDVADGSSPYNVASFQAAAQQAAVQIRGRGKLPVLVGGSGLYMDSVIFNYSFRGMSDTDAARDLEAKSVSELQDMLRVRSIDLPENKENKRYLIRSLLSGETPEPTDRQQMAKGVLIVGLHPDRQQQGVRIRARLEAMIEQGVIEEAQQALADYTQGSEALKGNIYQSLAPYFAGEQSLDEAKEDFIGRDMRLAKRQYTWFKRNKSIMWFEDPQAALGYLLGKLPH